MQHGDLDNRPAPKLLVVFENGIGWCADQRKHEKYMRKGQPAKALAYWWMDPLAVARVLYLFHRKTVNFEVVTFLGDEFCEELQTWLDLPVSRIWSTTPEDLALRLPYMHDLYCVYDPEPQRWLMYGKKGRFLQKPTMIGEGL